MGISKKHFLIVLLHFATLLMYAGEKLTFQEVDKVSYELFEKKDWKPLKEFVKEATGQGFDYYYLRMRGGIACFNLKQYFDAVYNFEKALGFNSGDKVATEYIFYCWLNLNNTEKARAAYKQLPDSEQESLKNIVPKKKRLIVEGGPIFSNQAQKMEQTDIDGSSNIYGEADITKGGYYFSAGLASHFKKGFALNAAYSLVRLNKTQMIKIQNKQEVDHQYPLTQQQFYLSGKIPVWKNFSILPSFNAILMQFDIVVAEFNKNTLRYRFPVQQINSNYFIGYLSLINDFHIVKTNLFGAYSNLNEKRQYQAGLKLLVFPLQNLNFYFSSSFLDHNNDGQNNLIFEQMVGGRLLKPVWLEIKATFGQMKNYYDNQAFSVYNFAGKMNFKGSAVLSYIINECWAVKAEYMYFSMTDEYLTYESNPENILQPIPVIMTQDFSNQLILLAINWKF